MSTAFAHRLQANLLFDPIVPREGDGNVIKVPGGLTQFKLGRDGATKPNDPNWHLWSFPPSRAVRSMSGGSVVRMHLEVDAKPDRYGGSFFGTEDGHSNSDEWLSGTPAELGYRNPDSFTKRYFHDAWDSEKDYIPCTKTKSIFEVWKVYTYDNDGNPVFQYHEYDEWTCEIALDGSYSLTHEQKRNPAESFTPADYAFVSFFTMPDHYEESDGQYWVLYEGTDITASDVQLDANQGDQNWYGISYYIARDEEADPNYSYSIDEGKHAWNPKRGDGSPNNLDKQICRGRVIMDFSIGCPLDDCWIAGKTYNVVVEYKNYSCEADASRSGDYRNDYSYNEEGGGSETFTYTVPNGKESGPVEIGQFEWDLDEDQARAITDVKLTSIT